MSAEIRMLRSTRRELETWHGRDGVTLADERARQRGTQTSTYTGAPVLDPTCEGLGVKFPGLLGINVQRAILLASATATTLNGLRARSCVSRGYFSGCWR